jgi:hypothetical protein
LPWMPALATGFACVPSGNMSHHNWHSSHNLLWPHSIFHTFSACTWSDRVCRSCHCQYS